MVYQEFLPAPALRPFIHHYGILELPQQLPKLVEEKVPPSPGRGLVFFYRCGQPVHIYNGTFDGELPSSFLIGQGNKSNIWKHQGGFGFFLVLFQPGQVGHFFHFSPQELANSLIPIYYLKDQHLRRLALQMQEVSSVEDRINQANAFFSDQLLPSLKKEDLSNLILRYIHHTPQTQLQDLSKQLFVTPRHLRRVFKEKVGLGLKSYQQLIRVCRSLHQLNNKKFGNISEVAFRWGFYDHTHFTNVFKSYTGLTPTKFLRKENSITSMTYWREEIKHE